MDGRRPTMAQRVAQAVSRFQHERTGHSPQSATAVVGDGTLVVTLHGALSPAEKVVAESPAGAAQVQEFHRQLFAHSADSLREEIRRITGVEVREMAAEVTTPVGVPGRAISSGTMVQVFLLAQTIPAEIWNDQAPREETVEPATLKQGDEK